MASTSPSEATRQMFTLAEFKPSSAHWVDGFQFSGEIKTRRMRQYLETREPFSNADDPLSVVIHNNITAAFQLLVFYGPFFGNEDYFTMVLQDMSGDWNPYGWKSRSMMHRLIMRYVSARLTYLGGATESQHIPPDAPDSARKLCRLVDQYRLCVFRPDIMPDLSSDEIKAIRYAWQKAFKEHPRTLLDSPPEMPVHLQQQRLQDDTVGPKVDHSTQANDHTSDNVRGRQLSVTLGKRSRSPANTLSPQDWPPAKKAAAERRVSLGRMYGWRSRQDASVSGSTHDGLQPSTPESTHASQMTAIKNEAPDDLADCMPQAAYGPQHAGAILPVPLVSKSTRKPRPTKLQMIIAQYQSPDDLSPSSAARSMYCTRAGSPVTHAEEEAHEQKIAKLDATQHEGRDASE